jgi:prevent-host-death family protein
VRDVDVGLRELRQQASDLVRRAEAGEVIVVTVSGRPAAQLVAVGRNTWRHYNDVRHLFDRPADPDWARDSELLDQTARDPWDAR